MKQVIAWVLRICCMAVIAVAIVTVARSYLHRNDDHSYEAVMGRAPVTETESQMESSVQVTAQVLQDTSAEENPNISVSADGSFTANRPTVSVTASFSNINNNIQARLSWYADGSLQNQEENRLLVDGSTAVCPITVDVDSLTESEVTVELVAEFGGQTLSVSTTIPVEQPGDDGYVVIQTEEIPVICQETCTIYSDSSLLTDSGGVMYAGDIGLLLGYENLSDDTALELQFDDGTTGWVSSASNLISDGNYTTDEDYTQAQKEEFVNSMLYDSDTAYLVWVSLYTQKVNVFTGYQGNWTLEECFDCATGVNQTPTTTGIYTILTQVDQWNLTGTYVTPVLVFNGGEAFTSQPYDSVTGEIANDTIGSPASGGSVWLQEDDIRWMVNNLSMGSLVVVY